mgnify:CR=1 FL=1
MEMKSDVLVDEGVVVVVVLLRVFSLSYQQWSRSGEESYKEDSSYFFFLCGYIWRNRFNHAQVQRLVFHFLFCCLFGKGAAVS